MTTKPVNISVLLLSSVIIGTVIAIPVSNSTNHNVNSLLQVILESMNSRSPNNHSYQNGSLLRFQKISAEDDPPVVKVTVLLESSCIEEPQCPREMCSMLITQDESNKLIVDDKSKECTHLDVDNVNVIDGRTRREATEIDVQDPFVKKIVEQVRSEYWEQYRKAKKPLISRMVNATSDETADGTKYVIFFNILEPTCFEEQSRKSCVVDDFSPTRLCKVDVTVDNRGPSKFTNTITHSSCEDRPSPTENNPFL